MADLPSILGGMAQGFIDFGKSAVDLFGTGGATIGDLIESARTGKVTTKNQDDFRKWLYNTDSVEDASAKGLGTALNGVQTAVDFIPGIGAVTKNPLFNAGQGALGGLADEFKMYGKDYDLGRAGERAAVGAGGALAASGLGDALKQSANPLLSSGTVQGLARGATGGAIGAGGYTAIEGGGFNDIMNSAAQGAGMGAAIGGATGALQNFRPAKTYDVALTDEEKAARIANARNMLANEQSPERIAELNEQIKRYGGNTLDATLADADMAVNSMPDYLGDEKYNALVKKAKNYKSLDRFEKMNNPIKGSEIWGEKPKSYFERDSRAVRINMFPNDAVKGTGMTKQYLLNMFKDAYDDGITDIVPSYGSYTKDGASFMDHLADQGWVKQNGKNGYQSYEIAPKIADWQKTNPLADIYNVANSTAPKALETTLANDDIAVNSVASSKQPLLDQEKGFTYDYDGSDMDAVRRAYNLATQDQAKLDNMLKEISDTLGTEFSSAGQKSMESMLNKVERKVRDGRDYTVGSMKDHTRGKVMMNSFGDIPRVLKELDSRGIPYETEVVTNDWGYKGYHITFRNPDGISSEIQLTTTDHWPAKLESDAIYDKWRNFNLRTASKAERKRYADAMAKSQDLWAKVDFNEFDRAAQSPSGTGRASRSVEPYTSKSGSTQEPSLYTKMPSSSESANMSPDSVTRTFSGLGFDRSPNINTPFNNIIPQNISRTLEGALSADDMALNSPRYIADENGNPMTFYHGSPNKNITEFDINQAGKNTSSGERALYFTDSPEVADEFSYERLPSDSMFIENKGAKGRVYPVNLEMNNPLDLDNLTDAQIRELWQYASPLGQLDGQEKFIKNLTEFRDAAHNGQLTKTLLDLDKLANSPYDGFTARMYPNQDNQAREYAVFNNSKVKMLEDVLARGDAAINKARKR